MVRGGELGAARRPLSVRTCALAMGNWVCTFGSKPCAPLATPLLLPLLLKVCRPEQCHHVLQHCVWGLPLVLIRRGAVVARCTSLTPPTSGRWIQGDFHGRPPQHVGLPPPPWPSSSPHRRRQRWTTSTSRRCCTGSSRRGDAARLFDMPFEMYAYRVMEKEKGKTPAMELAVRRRERPQG